MSRRAFLTAFFLVLALRLAALPLPGTEDVGVWRVWSFAASKDVLGVYGVGGSPPERRQLQGHARQPWPTLVQNTSAAAVSAVVALNMYLFYGLGREVGWAVPRMPTPIDLSVLLALANVALLVWHGRVLAREAGRV